MAHMQQMFGTDNYCVQDEVWSQCISSGENIAVT